METRLIKIINLNENLIRLKEQLITCIAVPGDILDQICSLSDQLNSLNESTILESSIDPRVENNILPNDAVLTYKYGARAYTSDIYRGYVWRNGLWIKLTNGLQFKSLSDDNRAKYMKKITQNHVQYIDLTTELSDMFDVIMINGIRRFIRYSGLIPSFDDASDQNTNVNQVLIYVPELQGCKTENIQTLVLNHLEFEDISEHSEVYSKYRKYLERNNS